MPDTCSKPLIGGKPAAPAAKYADFHLPAGVTLDPELTAEFEALAQELALPQDAAQRLVDMHASRMQTHQSANHAKWQHQSRNDAEIGGANLSRTIAVANRALDRFGTPQLRSALSETGIGNHPEFIRFVHRVGKALSEDGYVPASHGRVNKSYAETFYPSKSKE
jgi:hypothetical protein